MSDPGKQREPISIYIFLYPSQNPIKIHVIKKQ